MKKEIDDINFAPLNPTIAVPLLNTNMGLDDMVAIQGSDLDVTVDPDGFLRFIYFEELASVNATDFISIPDQSFNENIGGGPGTTGFGTQNITINNTTTFPFSNGEEVYQAILKTGSNLNLQFSHNYQHDVSITVTFPTATLASTPLSRTYNLNYTGLLPVTANDNIDLTGYDIDLTDGGGSFNTLPYTIDITITENVPNPVLGIESISADASFTNLQYSYLRGYLGQFNVPFSLDTVEIDIFDNSSFGNIFFEDPKARFNFDNSFGIPIEVNIDTLTTELNDGSALTITGTYDDTPVAIGFPSSGQVGQTIESDFTIDKNNSNVQSAFNPAPNKMFFAVTTSANPGVGKPENFVTDSSKLSITGEAEIPMDGRILSYGLSDTITDMELPDTTEDGYQEINLVTFKIETENGFPLDARIQGYFLDSNDVLIDTLFYNNENFANSGIIDGSGKVVQSTKSFIETAVDKERYKKIMFAKTMVILGTMQTTDGGTTPVKIYNTYFINIQMGVKVDGTIDIDDL